MTPKMNKKFKRLPKGQRTREQRVNQAAPQEDTLYHSLMVAILSPKRLGNTLQR
jgi:hypothetical protein